MKTELLSWRQASTKDEWNLLATLSGTTPGYLNLIAYGYRKASPRMATSIEFASSKIAGKPLITKESLVFSSPISAPKAHP